MSIVLRDSVTGNMTDDDFFRFCSENPQLRIERNNKLEVFIMSPVSSKYSHYNTVISALLYLWSVKDGRGLSFDSSAGFTLPDRSVLSPDASWVSREKWDRLTEEEKEKFAPVCPEFVIEVRSKSDNIAELKQKMRNWLNNGASLGWLIDPVDQATYVFRHPDREEITEGFNNTLVGDGPIAGFSFELSRLLEE